MIQQLPKNKLKIKIKNWGTKKYKDRTMKEKNKRVKKYSKKKK